MNSLASNNVGALIVSSDGIKVEGIISERDIVRGLQSVGPALLGKRARDLMTKEVVTCVPEDRAAGDGLEASTPRAGGEGRQVRQHG